MKTKTDYKNALVSLYGSKENSVANETSLETALSSIREGKYKTRVEKCRAYFLSNDKKNYHELKLTLQAHVFNGTFKAPRSKKTIENYVPLIVIDLDKIGKTGKNLVDLKIAIAADSNTLAVWNSPSNDGLKVLIKVDATVETHKVAFDALKKHFENKFGVTVDSSGSDITRLCFVSFDPDLYCNWDSEIFELPRAELVTVPKVSMAPKEGATVQYATAYVIKALQLIIAFLKKIPASITDTHEKWFKVGYAIASVLPNDEGKELYLELCRLDGPNHDEPASIAKWKYSIDNYTSQGIGFGTILHYAKLKGFHISKHPEKDFYFWILVQKTNKDNVVIDERIMIDNLTFIEFLEHHGFIRMKSTGGLIMIRKVNKILNVVNTAEIKDFLRAYIDALPENLSSYTTSRQLKKLAVDQSQLFCTQRLEYIDNPNIKMHWDTKDTTYFYFNNGVVEVTKVNINLIDYSQIEGCIWEKQIIDFDIDINDNGESDIFQFMSNVSNNDEDRMESLISAMGYLLSRYKDPTVTKAIIFLDEEFDDEDGANGGTGKSLLGEALGRMRNQVKFDGKNFKPGKNFGFQRVSHDTNLIYFDDVMNYFPFDILYSCITGGLVVEQKNKDEYHIPFDYSPKFLLTANNYVSGTGGNSEERRKLEILFAPHYNEFHTPVMEFGERFFEDWDNKKWNDFYCTMIMFAQFYLVNGLIKVGSADLARHKIKSETNAEFLTFADGLEFGIEYDVQNLYNNFRDKYYSLHQYSTQRAFNKWLKRYVSILNIKTKGMYVGKKTPIENRNGSSYIELLK
jgi:hypothetical protein